MARINVFLGEGLLEAIDAEAAESGMNRSALVQRALATYLEARQRERKEAEARRDMDEASRGMDQLAERLGDWDPGRIIREFRDRRAIEIREPRAGYRTRRRKLRS